MRTPGRHFYISLPLCALTRCHSNHVILHPSTCKGTQGRRRVGRPSQATRSFPRPRQDISSSEAAVADRSEEQYDRDLCLYRERLQKEKGGTAKSMFSIHEQRPASGRSHRSGGGFAECALGILIHGHSSPPYTPPPPLYVVTSIDTTPATADKTRGQAV